MTGLAFTAQAAAVFAIVALCASVLTALAYPRVRASSRSMAPAARARLLFGVALFPGVVGAAFLLLAVSPKLASLSLGRLDHCTSHTHHAHLCPVHAWDHGLNALAAVPLAGLAAAALTLGWRAVRTIRALRGVAKLPHRAGSDGAIRLTSPRVFAFTTGLLRPRIYVSTALEAAVGPSELGAVLEHEREHAARRDPLLGLLAATFSALHLPGTRRLLEKDFHLAVEQTCDEAAARTLGDRLGVAGTLLRVARLQSHAGPWPSTAFHGADFQARIEALLAPEVPHRATHRAPRWFLFAVASCAALVLADPLHHAAETLVAFLSR